MSACSEPPISMLQQSTSMGDNSHNAFTAFNDLLQGESALMLPPLPSTSAQPYFPPGLDSNSSNTMLDSVLNLALQQPQAATTSLEHDLEAAFFLPTEEAFFWSQFLSSPPAPPPAPSTSAAPIITTGPSSPHAAATSPAGGGYRPRILITAAGMPSRHGSPRLEGDQAEEDEEQHLMEGSGTGSSVGGRSAAATSKSGGGAAWPKAWEPTGHESAVRLDPSASFSLLALPKYGGSNGVGGEGAAFADGPGLPKFNEEVRIALLETLRFSQLSDDEYHALYGTVARIPLPVFDLLLSLYFSHFHPLLPLLHVPSFNPKKTLGQLLLIILGIGAVYAPIPGALQLGRVLVEVARRGIEHLINRDNRLARSLPIAQAQMLWAVLRWIGSARTVELAEVFRSVHTTMLRRQRVFDESGLRSAHDESPIAQWSAFIANEERRRTAMACYLLEGEVACLLHLPLSINSSELQTLLPCSEALWNAPNAEAWLQLKANTTEPVTIPFVTKLLTSDSSLSIPATISLSPFGAHVLIQSLHMNVAHVQQLHLSGMASHAELMTTQIRRSLVRLGRGVDEFSPRFNNRNEEDDPAAYAAPHAWYHFALLATYIPLEELDVTAHKESEEKAEMAREKWTRWMVGNAERARVVALHAGQLLKIVRNHPTHGTYEPLVIFYASLILYLYIRSTISFSTTNTAPYCLDGNLHDPSMPDCSTWLSLGGPISLSLPLPSSVSSSSSDSSPLTASPSSISLAGPASAVQVLRATSSCLAGQSVWRIGRVFAAVLEGMARKDAEVLGEGEGQVALAEGGMGSR